MSKGRVSDYYSIGALEDHIRKSGFNIFSINNKSGIFYVKDMGNHPVTPDMLNWNQDTTLYVYHDERKEAK